MTIDLGSDARYEFCLKFTLNQAGENNGNYGMGGMYLAGNSGSLYFGNQLDSTWDKDTAVVLKYSGDIANSTATPVQATANEYSRVKREVVDPSAPDIIDPSVPEPSAFGLLAGLGALALVASRRRR